MAKGEHGVAHHDGVTQNAKVGKLLEDPSYDLDGDGGAEGPHHSSSPVASMSLVRSPHCYVGDLQIRKPHESSKPFIHTLL